MPTANDLNISQAGYVAFDGTATFTGRTFQAGTGITISNPDGISGNSTIGLSGGGVAIDSFSPDTGTDPVIPTSGGLVNDKGSGSITTVGSLNTITTQLTGLTNHAVLVGAGTTTITKIAATATTGAVFQNNSGADPSYSTASYPSTAGTSGNVITSNGTNFISTAPGAQTKITTLNSTNTWTLDTRSVEVEFFIWSGGGGGGSGRCGVSNSTAGGGGGSSGNFIYTKCKATSLVNSPYTVTIGTGGSGGMSVNAVTTSGNPGNPGNPSSIGTDIVVPGGAAGQGGGTSTGPGGSVIYSNLIGFINATSGGPGGIGGTNGTTGILLFASGGGGGGGYTTTTIRLGGAGGAITDLGSTVLVAGGLAGDNAGNIAGNGNTYSGPYMIVGGTGGGGGSHDATLIAGSGGNGAAPGGGGGGGAGNLSSNASGAGGNGADGRVIIIEYF